MSEELPDPAYDEPAGDVGDQASRLQMAQEQEAIAAALAGRVHGTDELVDRGAVIEPLEGSDALEGDSVEASDDPVHGGGISFADAEGTASGLTDDESLDPDLAMMGLEEDGAAMALDEGSSVEDDDAARAFEQDGDPDVLDEEIVSLDDDETAAEDLDALIDVMPLGHDLDDPLDPDGYGVPPGPDVADDDEDAPRTD